MSRQHTHGQDGTRESTPATQRADHAFNEYKDADIILRTTDYTDIYAHKWMLSRISSVFRTMFELPQGTDISPDDGVKIEDVSEPAETIMDLLSFAYPDVENPTVKTVEKCRALIEATVKYDMNRLGEIPRKIARKEALIKSNPIASCALSLRYDIEGIRGIALDELNRHGTSLIGNATVLQLLQEGHLSAIEHYNLLVECRDRPVGFGRKAIEHGAGYWSEANSLAGTDEE